jgi:hypothetical protein
MLHELCDANLPECMMSNSGENHNFPENYVQIGDTLKHVVSCSQSGA